MFANRNVVFSLLVIQQNKQLAQGFDPFLVVLL